MSQDANTYFWGQIVVFTHGEPCHCHEDCCWLAQKKDGSSFHWLGTSWPPHLMDHRVFEQERDERWFRHGGIPGGCRVRFMRSKAGVICETCTRMESSPTNKNRNADGWSCLTMRRSVLPDGGACAARLLPWTKAAPYPY
jgi:hypothetical protein